MSQFTKIAIAASFKKLLSKKSLSSITVNEIVEDCGVNRGTFYYHFHDVYELLEYVFMEHARELTEYSESHTWQETFLKMFSTLIENKSYITNAYNSVNREILEDFLHKVIRNTFAEKVRQGLEAMPKYMNIDEKSINFAANIYGYSVGGLILDWIKNDMPVDKPAEILAQLEKLYPKLFFYTLKLLSK